MTVDSKDLTKIGQHISQDGNPQTIHLSREGKEGKEDLTIRCDGEGQVDVVYVYDQGDSFVSFDSRNGIVVGNKLGQNIHYYEARGDEITPVEKLSTREDGTIVSEVIDAQSCESDRKLIDGARLLFERAIKDFENFEETSLFE